MNHHIDPQEEKLSLEANRIVLKSMIGQYEQLVGVTKALVVTLPLVEAISAIDRRLLRLAVYEHETNKSAEAARRRLNG